MVGFLDLVSGCVMFTLIWQFIQGNFLIGFLLIPLWILLVMAELFFRFLKIPSESPDQLQKPQSGSGVPLNPSRERGITK